jgi:Domain of unknown function (DUF4382)
MRRTALAKGLGLALTLAACGGATLDPVDGGSGPNGHRGKLVLLLTDAPIQASEVWVTLSEIDLHSTGAGWQSLPPEMETFDLLKLRGGQQALLEQATLSAGKYTQIRLRVLDSYLIDLSGQRCEVKVPSDKIKIPAQFTIEADTTTRLVLDFDAEKSVHITQKGNRSECILRPVITQASVTTGG